VARHGFQRDRAELSNKWGFQIVSAGQKPGRAERSAACRACICLRPADGLGAEKKKKKKTKKKKKKTPALALFEVY